VIGGVLEWHWMGFSSYWSENSSLDWCWSAAGVIRGLLEWHWMGYSGYWSDWGWAGVALDQ
jgi:hypothetical protein